MDLKQSDTDGEAIFDISTIRSIIVRKFGSKYNDKSLYNDEYILDLYNSTKNIIKYYKNASLKEFLSIFPIKEYQNK